MKRMQWYGSRQAEKLGVAGLMAMAITLFCMVFVFSVWLPTRDSLAMLAVNKSRVSKHIEAAAATPEEKVQSFVALFPKRTERTEQIQAVMSKAKALDLMVDNVSYKSDQQQNYALSKTHVDFTLNCTYPEMRMFLNDVMTDMPFVSLDQLIITREDVASDVIEVRMRLTLNLVA